jgi:hypothetical protein
MARLRTHFIAAGLTVSGMILVLWASLFVNGWPDVRTSVARARTHFQPVLDALSKYHAKHGAYPKDLESLVSEGLIQLIPNTPPVGNARAGDLWYRASDDRKSFELHFSYHLKRQGLGVGDTTYARYDSRAGGWAMTGPGYE